MFLSLSLSKAASGKGELELGFLLFGFYFNLFAPLFLDV